MKVVEYRIDNGVSIITIDSPPVNALGAAVRSELAAALDLLPEPETKPAPKKRGKKS